MGLQCAADISRTPHARHHSQHTCFTFGGQELGAAGLTKRPTSCMLLLPKPVKGGEDDDEAKEFAESFADVHKRVKAVQPSVF